MRTAAVARETRETKIRLELCLDGGAAEISTNIGFFDHMLTLFSVHGGFGLRLACEGDTHVDGHHSVEDVGICLGTAFAEAVGDARGIARYGNIILPMDEALMLCAVDVSGRGGAYFDLDIPAERVGGFDTELCEEFFRAFASRAGVTLHLRQLAGRNSHHILEAAFKAAARALRQAVAIVGNDIPSTKGVIG